MNRGLAGDGGGGKGSQDELLMGRMTFTGKCLVPGLWLRLWLHGPGRGPLAVGSHRHPGCWTPLPPPFTSTSVRDSDRPGPGEASLSLPPRWARTPPLCRAECRVHGTARPRGLRALSPHTDSAAAGKAHILSDPFRAAPHCCSGLSV